MTGRRIRAALVVVAAAAGVAALTALVFLVRAGGHPDDAATWPIQWELRSSDNGVLFQFLQDVVAGRPLDWTFSPQVFVFPELPLSALAFVLGAGDVYAYYLLVAALHGAGMFLAILALVRVLFPTQPRGVGVLRALVASTPLVVLPLVGTSWILSFPLAPSYYAGEYAALLLAPVLLLARTRAARGATAAFLALTIAANPLTLLFAGAGGGAALLVGFGRSGVRPTLRPLAWVGATLAGAALARLALSPLQGTSPLSYIDLERFRGRWEALWPYYSFQARDPAAAVILGTGAVLAIVCLVVAVIAAVVVFRRRETADRRLLAVVYLGVVPLGGLLATFVALITHYYYFWPVLVLPFVLVLLAVPRRIVAETALVAAGVVVVVGVVAGATTNLPAADRYFGYRNAETRCLDDALDGRPALGYATFSDARRLSLTSRSPFRLIAVLPDGEPNTWMANRATARTEAGTFFYVNGRGDEVALDTDVLRERFGEPDAVAECSETQHVWLYEEPAKLDRIADFYGVAR